VYRNDANPVHLKERRYRRFDLQLPVSLTFPSAGVVRELVGVSKNVSSGGLLLKTSDQIPPNTRVSLTIKVEVPRSSRPVRLQGEGEVVRVERLEAGSGFAIAIAWNRPLAEVENPISR
jgi:hypothetical protein